ncbi:zeta toxin family protein [Candidatus Saccharibacteria bacterium]|nr:zeta toxin family protein [Candidatus Saccharibacteria bacterium]
MEWTKKHQKEIIDRIILDANLSPESEPMAIFMAGLPGAGKTELSNGFIKVFGPKFIRIDMDELATYIEGYQPEKADLFRAGATRILNNLFDKTIKKHLDFIMDGTFGSKMALTNVERVLKRGYIVQIAYAFQDPKLAWRFTKAREKVEHRAIKEDGFLEAYYKTISNLHELAKRNYKNVTIDIFVKNKDNTVGQRIENVKDSQIDDILKVIYNKDKLKEYIES